MTAPARVLALGRWWSLHPAVAALPTVDQTIFDVFGNPPPPIDYQKPCHSRFITEKPRRDFFCCRTDGHSGVHVGVKPPGEGTGMLRRASFVTALWLNITDVHVRVWPPSGRVDGTTSLLHIRREQCTRNINMVLYTADPLLAWNRALQRLHESQRSPVDLARALDEQVHEAWRVGLEPLFKQGLSTW